MIFVLTAYMIGATAGHSKFQPCVAVDTRLDILLQLHHLKPLKLLIGNGWAPSIPLVNLVDISRSNLKDLLFRAKAGMQAGDTQKEAHLSFYLAIVHENRKNYKDVILYRFKHGS